MFVTTPLNKDEVDFALEDCLGRSGLSTNSHAPPRGRT
jgi:hypothetical protein